MDVRILPFIEQQALYDKYGPYLTLPYSPKPAGGGNWWPNPETQSGTSVYVYPIIMGMGSYTSNWVADGRIPIFRCPSDSTIVSGGDATIESRITNYVGNYGPHCPWANCAPNSVVQSNCSNPAWGLNGSDPARSSNPQLVRGIFNWGGATITMNSVTDGLSNTLLVGEILVGQNARLLETAVYGYAHGWVDGKTWVNMGYTSIPLNYFTPDDPSTFDCAGNYDRNANNYGTSLGFKSFHTGGANFVLCDGSVRFVTQYISTAAYVLASIRNDGMPLPADW